MRALIFIALLVAIAPHPIKAQVISDEAAAVAYGQLVHGRLSAGLAVTFPGDPQLNGTYAVTTNDQVELAAAARAIRENGGKFPAGQTELLLSDRTGNIHSFTSPAEFLALVDQVELYITAVKDAALGSAAIWPAPRATIVLP